MTSLCQFMGLVRNLIGISGSDSRPVAPHDGSPQPTRMPFDLGKVLKAGLTLVAESENPPSVSERVVC